MNRILLAGSVPPPRGGVTIHVRRLFDLLQSMPFELGFIDLRQGDMKKKPWKYLRLVSTEISGASNTIIHYQMNNWPELLLISWLCRKNVGNHIISTVHSFRYDEFGPLKKVAFCICKMNKSIRYVAPSETLKTELIKRGIPDNQITVLNTYLPPSKEEICETVPQSIVDFLKPSGGKKVFGGASNLHLDSHGVDIYGLDMCIEACRRLKQTRFCFCVPKGDPKYIELCQKKIEDYQINDRFMLYIGDVNMVAILKYVDLTVRPTSTDSFGISVAESVDCGVPSIASDVCERAEGAILFRSRDLDDFVEKITVTERIASSSGFSHHFLEDYQDLYSLIS